jgi:serine/threonine protein kinase
LGQAKLPRHRRRRAASKSAEILAYFESIRPFHHSATISNSSAELLGSNTNRVLGTGGSSDVTLGRDSRTGSLVAVKRLGAEYEKTFNREVEVLRKLYHPCIVRILGRVCADGSRPAEIQTEYAPNGSLRQLLTDIQKGKSRLFASATGIGIIICGIVLGMRYMHSSGVIHRDLKPANILLRAEGYPMISDFGTCHLESEGGTAASESGTVYYSAPELLNEGVVATRKSDVFSFGLLLYEVMVGSPVLRESDGHFVAIRRLRARDLPAIPGNCGSLMEGLIPRCWSANPEDRPSFGEILGLFQGHQFRLLPNADANFIRTFCEAILEWERRAGISQ